MNLVCKDSKRLKRPFFFSFSKTDCFEKIESIQLILTTYVIHEKIIERLPFIVWWEMVCNFLS